MHRTIALSLGILIILALLNPPSALADDTLHELYTGAGQMLEAGELDSARALYLRVYDSDPHYKDVQEKLAETYKFIGVTAYGSEDLAAAIAAWETAATFDPDNQEIAGYIARAKAEQRGLARISDRPADAVSPPSPDTEPTDNTLQEMIDSISVLVKMFESKPEADDVVDWSDRISLSGFIDAVHYGDWNTNVNSFEASTVELDIAAQLSDNASARVDLDYGPGNLTDYDVRIEQAYASFVTGESIVWDFTFGRFNAPMGLESIDAADRAFFSRSALSGAATPDNLTGLMITATLSPHVLLSAVAANGWDRNTDNNSDKSFGGRLSFIATTFASGNIAALYGPEQDDINSFKRLVIDGDLVIVPAPGWWFGAEINYGKETQAAGLDGEDAEWRGTMLSAETALSESVSLAARFDYLDDEHGLLTGNATSFWAIAVAPSVNLFESLELRFEWQIETADEPVYPQAGSDPKDSRHTTALELVAVF